MASIRIRLLNFVFTLLIIALYSTAASASDINLTIHQQSINDAVTVTVQNSSAQSVDIKSVYIELNRQKYAYSSEGIIQPQKSNAFNFTVKMPSIPGSYPLVATVGYLNNGEVLTIKHVGIFNFQSAAPLNAVCGIEDSHITGKGDIVVMSGRPDMWKLILPEELEVISHKTLSDKKFFHIKGAVSGFRNTYPVFAIAEEDSDGLHKTAICSGMLTVDTTGIFQRGRIPSGILAAITAAFFIITALILNYKQPPSSPFVKGEFKEVATPFLRGNFSTALTKYSVRMFFIALSYYILKNADLWIGSSLTYISWKPYLYLANAVIGNLRGSNYQNFFHYFIDAYFTACLLLIFPYFYWLDRKQPLKEDKYVSLLKTILSVFNVMFKKIKIIPPRPPLSKGGWGDFQNKIHWSSLSRLGLLTIMVKVFFIPYMVSWAIGSAMNIKNLAANIQWGFLAINALLLELLMFTDTVVFAVGYSIESRYLKNEMKSVDPTFLGWLVCLWCYPPFNSFSFKPFDYQLIDIAIKNYPQWIHVIMTCAVTLLWGIFAWASIALGFKASNLTNRGIISSGPYRFVRHPAYTAKVLIWIIQGIFFGQFYLGILTAFAVIYFLRAWTEERHLSMGQDYIEYKRMVKWRFVPYLI